MLPLQTEFTEQELTNRERQPHLKMRWDEAVGRWVKLQPAFDEYNAAYEQRRRAAAEGS